jgi:hypothetical protein
MVNGERRLIFHSSDQAFHLDIFLDKFEMSHRLDLRQRLVVDAVTVPGAELLLTKLQVAEINRKDLIDILILLADHDFAESDGPLTINLTQVTDLLSADWGLYTTVSDNIAKTKAFVTEASMISPHMAERLTAQLAALENRIVASPKSVAWKFRARVGRRVRWFEVPEESLP